MNKQELFSYAKLHGMKKKKSVTMANHNKTTFEKGNIQLVVDSSPYSENIWDANVYTKGGSMESIRSFKRLEYCLTKLA